MRARANTTVYWPGLDAQIHQTRYKCMRCNETSPSLPKEPLIITKSPDYPYQQVCMDFFELKGHHYLVYVDRFSGWPTIIKYPSNQITSAHLMKDCRIMFHTYGVPELIQSDGGPQFCSSEFIHFLQTWGVQHRISSAAYPQSNGRAELAVKSAKRMIYENIGRDGSLNTNGVAKAMLQYRNTPLPELGLSPAQILLHRQLRDSIPSHPRLLKPHASWVRLANAREQAYAKRNEMMAAKYNNTTHTLRQLPVHKSAWSQDMRNKKQTVE